MARRISPVLFAVALLAGAVLFAAPASAGGGGHCSDPDQTVGKATEVALQSSCFRSTVTQVAPGDTVTFTNKDPYAHNVVGWQGSWGGFDDLQQGDSVSATFDAPGVYPFACYLHPGMVGAVVVGDDFDAGEVSSVLAGTDDPNPPSGDRSQPAGERASERSGSNWPLTLGALAGAGLLVAALVMFLERRRTQTAVSRPA
ncbi:MAG: cupredoxin domain-containing protein [Actinomycetota bacterium]